MGNSDGVNVDPDQLRDHAQKVEQAIEGVPLSREAADYLAQADDGYGLLVGPYAKSVLNPLHDRITESLRTLTEETESLPRKLRFAADSFENVDQSRADGTDRQREQLEQQV
ncbi:MULTISPECIES: type VII secretion target [Nocardia]|uniref:type VII secretion target n=1 Tax=Nocardia TaxID=1817 RepID=UPI0007A49AC0|nr:type VII secretion target [Nocardia pseudovaccinii]